jgi:hemoglobin
MTNEAIDYMGDDGVIFKYFEKSNIDRFRQRLVIHSTCQLGVRVNILGRYAGSYRSMIIDGGDFNRTVDLLINAIEKVGLTHRESNRAIARLRPHQKNIVYKVN